MKLYHITLSDKPFRDILKPRSPKRVLPDENNKIKRLSFSDSIKGCIFGIGQTDSINNGDIIRAYEVEISEDDDSLITPQRLYSEGLVSDALLSNEYWYLKPVIAKKYYEYKICDIKTKKHIIISSDKKDAVDAFLEGENIYYKSSDNYLRVINDLDDSTKSRLKQYLTFEKEQ